MFSSPSSKFPAFGIQSSTLMAMDSNSIHATQNVQSNEADLEKRGSSSLSPAISITSSSLSNSRDTLGYGKIAEVMQSDNRLLMCVSKFLSSIEQRK